MKEETMSTEQTLPIEQGSLVYVFCGKGIAVKRYRGTGVKAVIPKLIDGKPVVRIEKKAFLSCKTLREIVLPDSVEEIGDWAFAHTEELRTIILPVQLPMRGKELFLGCKRLREILFDCADMEERRTLGIGRMTAMAVTVLHDYFLFEPQDIGSDAWMKRWDEKLLGLVRLDDLDGFEELWTCGEEDYEGKDYDIKSYPVEKRKMKLRIVYFRLLHPYKISDMVKEELRKYLKDHTKGTSAPEAWDIIIEEHKEDLAYYKVFTEAGCVNEDNFDDILADMVNAGAELKAFMLRYKDEHFGQRDAFAALALDW